MRSAVILPVALPARLEAFRVGHVRDAALGVPAHLTLLFPFVPAAELDESHRIRLAGAVRSVPTFAYTLVSLERWPDTYWVRPEPRSPFDRLAARLAADWPEWPLYGDGTPFEPHVTVGQPVSVEEEHALRTLAAESLPSPGVATDALLISEGPAGRWEARWRLPLGGA